MTTWYSAEDAARVVMQTLWESGFEAYIVGGCVRDQFLYRSPKDYDVVTNAKPDQIAPLFEKTLAVGAKFGVVIASIGKHQVEIATYRSDGTYSDGRRPDAVTFSDSVQEDVKRRDFTMNGLIAGVAGSGIWPHVKDYVGGIKDIDRKLIRTIGDPVQRFEEDALRMLRAVRFTAQLDFTIEKATFKAIQDMAANIVNVSNERIRDELIKILMSPQPGVGMTWLFRSGLDKHILPDLQYGGRVPALFHLLEVVKIQKRTPVFMLGLLASVHTHTAVRALVDSLRVSAADQNVIIEMMHWRDFEHVRFGSSAHKSWMKRRLRRTGGEEGLELFRAHCMAGESFTYKDLEAVEETVAALRSEGLNPERLLTGEDFMEMGITGSMIGLGMRDLETEQLEGRIGTREQAIEFVRAYA